MTLTVRHLFLYHVNSILAIACTHFVCFYSFACVAELLLVRKTLFLHKRVNRKLVRNTKGATKSTDTVIIYKKEEEKKAPAYNAVSNSSMRKKVIVLRPSDTAEKPKVTYKDTTFTVKRSLTGAPKPMSEKEKVIEIMKNNDFCKCVKMDIDVSPMLQYETYLNYSFVFKNNCKIDVWVSSKHFRFTPYNSFNKPVKVIRQLSFVQRYDHPDFVKIMPGETYTFKYGDDAFFEYDLRKGQSYKFIFEHRNFGIRSKMAPEKTYLCGQKRTQLITVK